jgi:hypothetical protein
MESMLDLNEEWDNPTEVAITPDVVPGKKYTLQLF